VAEYGGVATCADAVLAIEKTRAANLAAVIEARNLFIIP
jgi:hypothetical protein